MLHDSETLAPLPPSRRMVALLPQEETTEDGMQLLPPGLNAIVLPFADEVREAKATTAEEGDVKPEGWLNPFTTAKMIPHYVVPSNFPFTLVAE